MVDSGRPPGRPTLKSGGWKMWTVVDEWTVIFLTILGIVCPKIILSKEFYQKQPNW